MTSILLGVIAVCTFLSSALGVAHLFKLDALAASQLDSIADRAVQKALSTPDKSDDARAQGEAAFLHAAAQLLRDGKVQEGLSVIEQFAKVKAGA